MRSIRHERLLLSAVVTCAAWLLAAAPALAQPKRCEAPPGRSGIDQYCESLPGASGDSGPAGKRGKGSPLSKRTRSELAGAGAAGRALRAFVESSGGRQSFGGEPAGGRDGPRAGDSDRDGAEGERGARPSVSSNPLSAVRSAVDTGASAGPAFLWVLLGVVFVLGGLAWIRYRRRGAED